MHRKYLDQIIKEKSLKANGVIGFYAASATATDDLTLFTDDNRTKELTSVHFLRQQNKKAQNLPNFCLSDFIAPEETKRKDYFGMFAVTAGIGIEVLIAKYKADTDDYSEIMVKALADRLAEAFAELMHARVRKEYWGYAKDETLSEEQLIKEEYLGIRPAPGYPACPDHTRRRHYSSYWMSKRRQELC